MHQVDGCGCSLLLVSLDLAAASLFGLPYRGEMSTILRGLRRGHRDGGAGAVTLQGAAVRLRLVQLEQRDLVAI